MCKLIHDGNYDYFKFRSSQRKCCAKKGVPENFAKFAGKHLCQRLFFNKFPGNFIKKVSGTGVFL